MAEAKASVHEAAKAWVWSQLETNIRSVIRDFPGAVRPIDFHRYLIVVLRL